MLKIIKELKKNQLTYEVNGGVYLDITKVKDFGKLSQLSLKEMPKVAKEFEEDVDNPDKKHPLDITLWRPTGKNQPKHIPSFQSLYGPGRPGWHLECSAMAICSLGEQIDIHGGGIDLMYPHHDSEIAQSEGATSKKPFAKYWIHTAPVRYKGEKMSKSLGNMVMISDLLKGHSANAIRFVLLTHHYRETWEFHEKELEEAQKKVDTIEQALKNKQQTKQQGKNDYEKQFIEAMDDDMNTPKALNVLVTMAKEGNDLQTLRKLFTSLGFV
jgi:cysteinyl-tRNA synthetase